MTTEIILPLALREEHLKQIIDLIVQRGEIKRSGLKEKIMHAEWVAYLKHGEQIICTATLKNPSKAYKSRIFNAANVKTMLNFDKELGYAATDRAFEGQGKCQALLHNFMEHLMGYHIYAITKEPAMVHILQKLKFAPVGETYKDKFQLLTYPSLP